LNNKLLNNKPASAIGITFFKTIMNTDRITNDFTELHAKIIAVIRLSCRRASVLCRE
jgi:hypothetical protein